METERRWLSNMVSFVLPTYLAARLLKPKYRTGRPDPLMERVIRIRAWLGLAVVFAVFVRVFYERHKKTPPGTVPTVDTPATGGVPTIPDLSTLFPSGYPTNFPTNFNTRAPDLGLPPVPQGTGDMVAPSMDALANNVPMPQATGPTGFPTANPMEDANRSLEQVTQIGQNLSDGVSVGQELAGAVIDRIMIAPVLCALGIVVLGLVLVLSARPHARTATLHQLRHPIRVVVIFAIPAALGIGAYLGLHAAAGLRGKTYMLNEDGTTLQLALSWGSVFALFWTLLYSLGALWQVTRHLFAAIDGHPLLPALLATWLAWTLVLNDLTLELGSNWVPLSGVMDGNEAVPSNMKAGIGILGATAITVLALWEISRIGKWNGINFRSGPFGNRP
ncbi:hypothetical protein [Yinghuangia sp. YIM S09857]|uniref:hypothetical protein n=1 Tax=Yinghuangia sp. YIM S09857 TaxID=3436929 RepID=UPI003F52A93E